MAGHCLAACLAGSLIGTYFCRQEDRYRLPKTTHAGPEKQEGAEKVEAKRTKVDEQNHALNESIAELENMKLSFKRRRKAGRYVKGIRDPIRELRNEVQKLSPDFDPCSSEEEEEEEEEEEGEGQSVEARLLRCLHREVQKLSPGYLAPHDDEGTKPHIRALRREICRLNPSYRPGFDAVRTQSDVTDELKTISHNAATRLDVKQPPPPPPTMTTTTTTRKEADAAAAIVKPNMKSKDEMERLVAQFVDPELREHYWWMWNYGFLRGYEKDDVREMVRERMGPYGIVWEEGKGKGNPFGEDPRVRYEGVEFENDEEEDDV